jgi:hypothetical protein
MRTNLTKGVCIVQLLLAGSLFSRAQEVVSTLQVGQSFTASTYGIDSSATPPDTDGAAGPSDFVEFINGRYAVFSKSDGTTRQSITDTEFWNRAGLTIPSGWEVTDPRIIFDIPTQRWFALQVDFDPSGVINTNVFLLAVSAGPDPAAAWSAVALPSDPRGADFADFPTMGLDSQAVYISGDMFDVNGSPAGPTLFSIPKAGLLASPPSTSGRTWFGVMSYTLRGHILQPAVCVDGSAGGSVLGLGGLGVNDFTGQLETNTTLIAWNVLNAASAASASLSNPGSLSVPDYTAPIDPTQPDSSHNLDDGDARMGAAAYRVGGVLYAVHATEVNNLAAIQWFRVRAADNVLLEAGAITDPTLDLFYPSIAANTNGTVVIACNGSSINTYVSCYAALGQTVNGITTFGSLTLLKAGAASYHAPGSTRTSRWGDYSAVSVDPADPTRFWTIQAYPSSRSAWSTQVIELLTTPAPSAPALSIARTDGNLLLSWPGAATAFQLQSTTNLSPGTAWSALTEPVSTNGNVLSVVLPLSAGQQFFRLQKPAGLVLSQNDPPIWSQ